MQTFITGYLCKNVEFTAHQELAYTIILSSKILTLTGLDVDQTKRDVVLNGYEQSRGVWVDSTGNQLKYLPWCGNNPSNSMSARYLGMWSYCSGSLFDDDFGSNKEYVVCVKCSSQYSVPNEYSCLETDFGIMVVKSYNQEQVSAAEARALCAADANYVHLPMPQNAAQNMWYINYAKTLGFSGYWLGINDVKSEGQWITDTDDIQTYLPWKSGLEVTETLYRSVHVFCLRALTLAM